MNQKDFLRQCSTFLKFEDPEMQGQGHHMTKYGQNYSFGSIYNDIQMSPVAIFVIEKTYLGSVKYSKNLRSKDEMPRSPNMGKHAVLELNIIFMHQVAILFSIEKNLLGQS